MVPSMHGRLSHPVGTISKQGQLKWFELCSWVLPARSLHGGLRELLLHFYLCPLYGHASLVEFHCNRGHLEGYNYYYSWAVPWRIPVMIWLHGRLCIVEWLMS